MREEYELEVLEQYNIEVKGTRRIRGAFFCDTNEGTMLLKETKISAQRAPLLYEALSRIEKRGNVKVDVPVFAKDGDLLVTSREGTVYMLKRWYQGRECDIRQEGELLRAAGQLGRLHRELDAVSAERTPVRQTEWFCCARSPLEEIARHNRELKKVRRYLRQKGQKSEFEIYLLHHYDGFYEKALETAEKLQEETADGDGAQEAVHCFCHGDFQHHNLLCCRDGFAVINFEKYLLDNPVRDLYLFLRKLLEKNSWSPSLALSILTAYETQRTLSDQDRRQLYYRFAYPEKFWKIVNFYYNSGKAWIPGRNREKLENLLRQEEEKKAFLDSVLK